MFAGKKSAQIREILISESAWEEMTCLFAPSLALAWILKQSDLITLLSGATAPEQVRENVEALTIPLTDDDSLLMRRMAEALDIN
ncbi:hypothetical protein CIFRMM088M_04740 [Citrobacter freundii]|nr:aldo/keto reductase [Citrobacter freundii]QMI74047.1 aldo/keto reductase [Citrobacter freundii]